MSAGKRICHLDRCLHLDIELPKNVALKGWNHIGGKLVDRIRRHCQGDLVLNQESMPLLPGTDLAPKRAHFFHHRTDRFVHEHCSILTRCSSRIFSKPKSRMLRVTHLLRTLIPFLTPSSTLSHHSLSPSTNLLSVFLLDTSLLSSQLTLPFF